MGLSHIQSLSLLSTCSSTKLVGTYLIPFLSLNLLSFTAMIAPMIGMTHAMYTPISAGLIVISQTFVLPFACFYAVSLVL